MAKSLGSAFAEQIPVVLNSKEPGRIPELFYKPGDEVKALELLEKLKIIKRALYTIKP